MAGGPEQRGLPRLTGHRMGVDNIRPVLTALAGKGVRYVSLYAFSTENWNRPATEVEGLMDILRESIEREVEALHEQDVRIPASGSVGQAFARTASSYSRCTRAYLSTTRGSR